MQVDEILTKQQQEEFINLFKQVSKYTYKDNFYIFPENNKYHIYDKLITPRKLIVPGRALHNFNISVEELFKRHSRYVTTKDSELEAKTFIDGIIYSQGNCLEETMIRHTNKHNTIPPQKQHVISQSYMRQFAFDPHRNKNKQRVYTLDKKDNIKPRKIANLNYVKGYNTEYAEGMFSELEKITSYSLNSIIRDSFTEEDISNIKLLTSYFIANQPRTRSFFYKLITKGKESEKEEQGTISIIPVIHQLLLKWDYVIDRTGNIQSQMYITSDNPVYLSRMEITSTLYITEEERMLDLILQAIQKEHIKEIERIQKSKNKVIYRYPPRAPSKMESPSILSVPEDTTIIFPLNPHTAIYFYQNEKEKKDIINDKSIIEKSNLRQIEGSEECVISQNEDILKKLHKKRHNNTPTKNWSK